MSLTSFLDIRDVRERFRMEFPKPQLAITKELSAPPRTTHYALVGTAFDYLLRFYLQHLNHKAIAERWIAEISLEMLANDVRLYRKASKIVSEAKENHRKFLKTGKFDDDLLKSALLLAQLDPIFRALVIDENIGVIHDDDVEDLRKLISIADSKIFKANDICLLDPTFGEASTLVGGADVDLVIDDTMIDIKTTKNLELTRKYYDQLIGYYTLFKIGGLDGMPSKHEIKYLGIYFSRYAHLYTMNVKEITNEYSFPKFLEWFKERARREF